MTAPRKKNAAHHISLTNLLLLAFLNARRHGIRAAINVAGIAVTVAALVFFLSFYRGTYEGIMFSSVIDYSTSHGQFMTIPFDDDDPESWIEGQSLFDETLIENGTLAAKIETASGKNNAVLAPRIMTPAFAGDGSRKAAAVLAGVDFEREKELLSLDDRMVEGRFGGGAVIGKKLAAILSLSVGDEIRIQANTVGGAPNLDYWKVSGIYSTGYPPMDRSMVFLALEDAQRFLDAEGKINKAYCRIIRGRGSIERESGVSRLLAEGKGFGDVGLKFSGWKSYAKAIVADAKKDGQFFAVFIAILVFLSLSTMAGTMRVTVIERKREIGMLRASGWFRGEIVAQFLLEALAIGIVGSAVGCVLGGATSLIVQHNPISFGSAMEGLDIPSFALTCDPRLSDFLRSAFAGLATALLAGIVPARSAASMPILDAIAER